MMLMIDNELLLNCLLQGRDKEDSVTRSHHFFNNEFV